MQIFSFLSTSFRGREPQTVFFFFFYIYIHIQFSQIPAPLGLLHIAVDPKAVSIRHHFPAEVRPNQCEPKPFLSSGSQSTKIFLKIYGKGCPLPSPTTLHRTSGKAPGQGPESQLCCGQTSTGTELHRDPEHLCSQGWQRRDPGITCSLSLTI